MDGFAAALSGLDEVVLLPVYPAREEPVEDVTSEALADRIRCGRSAVVVQKAELTNYICGRVRAIARPVTVLTLGAGDIDRLVADMAIELNKV